jgi:UDP-glucose 4-epimerase
MPVGYESALVTGGAGFIGSHLVAALAAGGVRVAVLDDLSSGHLQNLAAVADRIRFVRGDVRDRGVVAQAAAGCEVVFHLAAVVSVPKTTEDPLGSAAVNETGTLNVLEEARSGNARRLVFASSSAVYGDDPVLPKHEEMAAKPLTPYAVQKLASEYHLKVYNGLYGLETVSLRFFNVFGPKQDPSSPYSGVISIFMNQALRGRPPVIHGDGRQTRDFVFVGDVVRALIAAAESPSAPGRVFNVGTGRSVAIKGLWESVAGLTGVATEPVHGPPRAGDVPHSLAAIDAAREHLNFTALTSIAKGLETTLRWYETSGLAGGDSNDLES